MIAIQRLSAFSPTMTGKKSTIIGAIKLLSPLANGLISIIIPTIDEQSGIEETIRSIPKSYIGNKLGYEIEIIVIDGQSTDSTCEIATRLGARVIIEKRRGYGRAIKSGFTEAKGDILVTLDADNTYPTEYIPTYIKELNDRKLEFITINRFSHMEKGAMSTTRMIGNKILTFSMRLLYSINVKDSQSGMWVMKRSFISQIRLCSDDMSLSEEIKIIAFRFFKSAESDGRYYAREGTAKLKVIQDGWKNFKYLFQYKPKLESAVIRPSTYPREKEISMKG
jgi:dolichol-phosphate hexosyltransferase